MNLEKVFGYGTVEELNDKMKTEYELFPEWSGADIDEISFKKVIERGKTNKTKLLSELGLLDDFDDYGRKYIKVSGLEDEEHKKRLAVEFQRSLPFETRITIARFSSELHNQHFSKDYFIPEVGVSITKGMKVGRGLRKVLSEIRSLDNESVEYFVQKHSVIHNEKNEGYLVMSINPLDFLSMSWGYNWSSCVSKGGEYESASVNLMADDKTMVGFLISTKDYEKIKDDSEVVPKKWRKLFTFSQSLESVLANKGYPYDGAALTQHCLMELMPFERYFEDVETRTHNFRPIAAGAVYNDADYQKNKISIFFRDTNSKDYTVFQDKEGDEKVSFYIGENVNCLKCDFDYVCDSGFIGTCCSPGECCDCCGDFSEEVIWLDLYDEAVCSSCIENNFVFSESEGDYILYEDSVYVESESDYFLDTNPNLKYCKKCNEYYILDSSDDDSNICDSCFDDKE